MAATVKKPNVPQDNVLPKEWRNYLDQMHRYITEMEARIKTLEDA